MKRFFQQFSLFCASLLVVSAQSGIDPSRRTTWTPGQTVGVPNGIPTNRSHLIDVRTYGADDTGANDSGPAIQNAINAAQANQVVYLPAGTYRVDNQLNIGASRDRITLRGAGMNATRIVFRGGGNSIAISVGSAQDFQWNSPASNNIIIDGQNKNSDQIRIADASPFSVGQLIQIGIANGNDPTLPVTSVFGFDLPYNSPMRRQMAIVTAKNATTNTLTISPPLYSSYNGATARVNGAQAQTDFVGLEDFTLDCELSQASVAIQFEQTYGCWLRNVRTTRPRNYQVFFYDSVYGEMRRCILDHVNGKGPNHAALLVNTASGCLFEDNIINKAFPLIEVNHGASGNVFAYNFCEDSTDDGVTGSAINVNHGPHNDFNLYEGNIAANIQSDGFFGSASEDTLFRNWLHGTSPGVSGVGVAVILNRFTRKYNIVGNILGKTGRDIISYSLGNPNLGNANSYGLAPPWPHLSVTGIINDVSDAANGIGTIVLQGGATVPTSFNSVLRITWGGSSFRSSMSGTTANPILNPPAGANPNRATGPISTNGGSGSPLPPAGTVVQVWVGPAGFQEKDDAIQSSTYFKANYSLTVPTDIPGAEVLTGTLEQSLYLPSKPLWFGTLAWPAFGDLSVGGIPNNAHIVSGAEVSVAGGTLAVTAVDTVHDVLTTSTSHGYWTGVKVRLEGTAVPGGSTAGTIYFVRVLSENTFALYGTYAQADASNSNDFTGRVNLTSAGTNVTVNRPKAARAYGAIPAGYRFIFGEDPPTAPYFTNQPVNAVTTVGGTATFSITAEGFPLPTYRWMENGVPLTDGTVNGITYSGSATATLTISGATFALNARQYVCVATNTIDGTLTPVQSTAATLTVNKADQTITFAALPGKTFGNAPFTVTGSASSNLPLTFSIESGPATISSTVNNIATVTITGAGEVKVRASQGGDSNYNAAPTVDQQFTVAKASATINFPPLLDCVFGDPSFSINLMASSGATVTLQSSNQNVATITGTTVSVLNAGDTTITASAPSTENFLAATAQQNFHVNKANATITFGALTGKTFGNAPFGISATSNNTSTPIAFSIVSGPASIASTTSTSATVTLTGAGSVTVRAAQVASNNFNAAQNVDQTFAVAKANQTITFAAPATRAVNAAPFVISATTTNNTIPVTFTVLSGPAAVSASSNNSATVTIAGTPGTVTLRAVQAGNADFNAADNVDRQFTITSLGTTVQTITFAALAPKTFGDAPFALSASATSNLAVDFAVVSGPGTLTGNTLTITGAGTIVIRASQGGDATFATATAVDQSLVVEKAAQTITFGALSAKSTTDAPFTISGSTNSNLPLTFAIVSGPATISSTVNNVATVTLTGAGTVVVRATQAGNANYNAATNVDQSFVVTTPVVTPPPTFPPVIVTPSGAPSFTTQPAERTASVGGEAVFSAFATGASSYQWFRNGTAVAGATNTSLVFSDVKLSDAGTYHVVATNNSGSTASNNVALNVISAPVIATHPASKTVAQGSAVTFSVTASGFPALSYQWRKNGSAISGATNSSLSLSNVQSADAGGYDVVITNTLGTTTSNPAVLAVNLPSYAGTYFGSFSGGGSWALYVRADNTATYIATLPDRAAAIVLELSINANGSFSIEGTEINSQSARATNADTPPVAAVGSPFTLTGTISGGQVTGQLAGLGKTMTGAADSSGPASSMAGFYRASALVNASGTTYSIVGASGQALVVTTSPTLVDAATGTIGANGQLTATTQAGGQVTLNVSPTTQQIAAIYRPAGNTASLQFAGLNDTAIPTSALLNLSIRATAGTNDNSLIAGFVITGASSKNLLIRGIGPTLSSFDVPGFLPDPTITVLSGAGVLASNDDWGSASNSAAIATTTSNLGAFGLPNNSRDAVVLVPSGSGSYSAQISAKESATGVALLEVYDASPTSSARLVNMSARTQVGANAGVLIVGFVVDGNVPKQILVRAIGPTLTNFNVPGVLSDPQLELFQGNTRLQFNDNWGGTTALRTAFNQVGAFDIADSASKDAAMLVTLQPGSYTAIASGIAGTTGVALVEIYILP